MDRPTLSTVLNLFHFEETDWVATTEVSESCGETVSQEIEMTGRFVRIICRQDTRRGFNSFKSTIDVRGDRSIVILSNFDDLYAMRFVISRLEYGYIFIFARLNPGYVTAIQNNFIDVPCIFDLPDDLIAAFEAKRYLEAGPIVVHLSLVDVVSACEGE